MHTLELFFTLSHTLPLHDSHLNTGFLIYSRKLATTSHACYLRSTSQYWGSKLSTPSSSTLLHSIYKNQKVSININFYFYFFTNAITILMFKCLFIYSIMLTRFKCIIFVNKVPFKIFRF